MAGILPVEAGGKATHIINAGRRLFPLILFLIALLPRLAALERYITPDELVWVYRSLQFREAIAGGHWASTLVAGHPGVTTTWLGSLGLTLQLWLSPGDQEAYRWLTRLPYLMPGNVEATIRLAEFLTASRLMVALVNSAGIVAAFYLLRRLWGNTAAVLSSLFLALDPFLAGLSGLLHVDGLSATFSTLTLLAIATAYEQATGRKILWLVLSGLFAGLAALTKSPTLLLLPLIGLLVIFTWSFRKDLSIRDRLWGIIRDGLVLGGAAAISIFALFPALWQSPFAVFSTIGGSANRHLDEALRETFFMGQVAYDHGPLFYPVVLLWRLSPVVWLALIPLGARWLDARTNNAIHRSRVPGLVWVLMAWCLMFLLAITPAAKKFDRYILPVVPAFLLLAGFVWASWGRHARQAARWGLPLIVTAQALFLFAHVAYPLAAYNPLVGGSRTAVRVLPMGWGEGISTAGRRLAAIEPDAKDSRAIAGIVASLAPFFPGRTLVEGRDDPSTADFVIVTLGGYQLDPEAFARQVAGLESLQTIHYGGVDQAWVYRRPNPSAVAPPAVLPEPVVFGDRVALTAIEQKVDNDNLQLRATWQRLAPLSPDERFGLRFTILDEAGSIWSSAERDLLNEVDFYPADWENDRTGAITYSLELPPAIPPGSYQVRLSLIDSRTGGQLPVRTGGDNFEGVGYEIGAIDVLLPESIVSASRVQIPQQDGARWLDDSLWLLGSGTFPAEVLAGSDIPVELFWHAPTGSLPAGLQLVWTLEPADGTPSHALKLEPLSRFDSENWRVGETIHERYRLPLPPDLAAGNYDLFVQPVSADGALIGQKKPLAQWLVNNIDRDYELPPDVGQALETCFAELVCLRGTRLEPTTAASGETVDLTLYWQALEEPGKVYTAFLHVLNEADEIVMQADHWPGGLPSDIWDAGQVITDRVPLVLPPDLRPGTYRFRVGLYSPDDGLRLPVSSGEGSTDHVILPLVLEVRRP